MNVSDDGILSALTGYAFFPSERSVYMSEKHEPIVSASGFSCMKIKKHELRIIILQMLLIEMLVIVSSFAFVGRFYVRVFDELFDVRAVFDRIVVFKRKLGRYA